MFVAVEHSHYVGHVGALRLLSIGQSGRVDQRRQNGACVIGQ